MDINEYTELAHSLHRLSDMRAAVAIDTFGEARIVKASDTWPGGCAVWSDLEMFAYARADVHSRTIMRGLKALGGDPF